jgi:hypothetical protein
MRPAIVIVVLHVTEKLWEVSDIVVMLEQWELASASSAN